jgi:hypothetical protein
LYVVYNEQCPTETDGYMYLWLARELTLGKFCLAPAITTQTKREQPRGNSVLFVCTRGL